MAERVHGESATAAGTGGLARLPVALFGATLGLGGLALAWQAAAVPLGVRWPVGQALALANALLWCALALGYAAKAYTVPTAAAAEWRHPVKANFFAAIPIGLLLVAAGLERLLPAVAGALAAAGAALLLVATLATVASWVARAREPQSLGPVWFIPAVGNVVAPLALAPAGFEAAAWFFYATGLGLGVALLALVLGRLVLLGPLPERLAPTLAILIAPPAVAFLAYLRLEQGLDAFARGLYGFAVFSFLLVLVQAPRIARSPFSLAHWALTFPLAAFAAATLRLAGVTGAPAAVAAGALLLAAASAIVLVVALRTLAAFLRGALEAEG